MILTRLFKRNRSDAPAVPAGSRVYAIGDIHGRADLLERLRAKIRRDAEDVPDQRKVVVYLGDYIDRGLESRRVIELLLDDPLEGFESVHLCGNHEVMMLHFLDDIAAGPGWLENGGMATLLSYKIRFEDGMSTTEKLREAHSQLAERLPAAHRRFLSELKLSHREGDFLFVHAGIRPGVPLNRQKENDLLWIRGDFLSSSANHGMVVVHGHSVTWDPEVRPNRICVDTGAYASGTLTALVLSEDQHRFLDSSAVCSDEPAGAGGRDAKMPQSRVNPNARRPAAAKLT